MFLYPSFYLSDPANGLAQGVMVNLTYSDAG
jgi:hypothetical protein